MANQNKAAPERAPSGSPVSVVLIGAICLAAGLALGYYFGRQSAETGASGAASTSQAPAPGGGATGQVVDPAVLQENETRLKSALRTNPKDLTSLIQLGNLYYDSSRFNEAVDYYGRALALDSRNVDVLTDRGTSYWNLGQADAAIGEFQKALGIDGAHAQTLYNMGVVYLNGKNEPAEARKAWEKLLATNPNYPDRAKVQEQIRSLGGAPGMPATSGAEKKGDGKGVEDLLQRMKSRP
jgi:tetratricopeptide (TPR) repeat protein